MHHNLATLAIFLAASAWLLSTSHAADRPNIIFILADDLGYGDLAHTGAPDVETPHLDALAARGITFTSFYNNGPECTPTRTALLTGRYQQRAGGLECAIGTGDVGRYDDAEALAATGQLGLPPEMAVLPRALKDAGYATGIFGKWHLGYRDHFNPLNYGFDQFFGVLGGNCEYYTHKELSPIPVVYENREPVEREGYMTHLITDHALMFLKQQHGSDSPFFLYLPYTTPHFPFQPPGDRSTYTAENWTAGTRENYVAMVEDLDTQVGRIISYLADNGFKGDTVVAFASDHGAMKPGRNLPYRDFKGTLFEGGIRAPLTVFVPDSELVAKKAHFPALTFDLTHTFLNLAGVENTADLGLDGIDLIPHVRKDTAPQRPLFWRSKRGDRTWRAARVGDLKYISKTEAGQTTQHLFDLATDPHETHDLLDEKPGETSRLKAALKTWESLVAAPRP